MTSVGLLSACAPRPGDGDTGGEGTGESGSSSETTDTTDSTDTGESTGSESETDTGGPECGNGLIEGDEQCDDGNVVDNDGCDGDCTPTPFLEDVYAGTWHTCVLFDDHSVRCWGAGGFLGYGHAEAIGDDETPASAGDVVLGAGAVSIGGGANHTCAVTEAGNVRCWGASNSGQLGYGNTEQIGDNETPASAGDVDLGGAEVDEVAAGWMHTCVRLDGGGVRCWGWSEWGQAGYGNQETIGDDETPAMLGNVDVGATAVSIAAGHSSTCVVTAMGNVRCWGANAFGNLGYGHTEYIGDDEVPSTAGDVDLGGTAVMTAVGWRFSCALLDDGNVRCFGNNEIGQLGRGDTVFIGDDESVASGGDAPIGGKAIQIAAGTNHACALLEGGSVRCWGGNEYGQLGYGHTDHIGDDETPESAGDVDVGGEVVGIAVGANHTCARMAGGTVRCWGEGAQGQLGYANTENIGDDELPSSAGDVKIR